MSNDHAADLVRSAKVRALLVSFISASKGAHLSKKVIEESLTTNFQELGYNPHNLMLLLSRMAKNNLIGKSSLGEFYSLEKNVAIAPSADDGEALEGEKPSKNKPGPKKKLDSSSLPPDIKIDLVKATGKVRITLNGISIEIGVV